MRGAAVYQCSLTLWLWKWCLVGAGCYFSQTPTSSSTFTGSNLSHTYTRPSSVCLSRHPEDSLTCGATCRQGKQVRQGMSWAQCRRTERWKCRGGHWERGTWATERPAAALRVRDCDFSASPVSDSRLRPCCLSFCGFWLYLVSAGSGQQCSLSSASCARFDI